MDSKHVGKYFKCDHCEYVSKWDFIRVSTGAQFIKEYGTNVICVIMTIVLNTSMLGLKTKVLNKHEGLKYGCDECELK